MGKIIVAGIGPGDKADTTPAVLEAMREADAIVGYKYYFQFAKPYLKEGCKCKRRCWHLRHGSANL